MFLTLQNIKRGSSAKENKIKNTALLFIYLIENKQGPERVNNG